MENTNEPADWFLRDWAKRLGKRQADLVNTLGWTKNSAFKVWHGRQPYSRKTVNQISAWLGIQPYELLMPPERAMALRRLKESAAMIVAEASNEYEGPPPPAPKRDVKRTGTRG